MKPANVLSPEGRAALRALAAGATQGPWRVDSDGHRYIGQHPSPGLPWRIDARYLAALSPEVVTGLLDALDGVDRSYVASVARAAVLASRLAQRTCRCGTYSHEVDGHRHDCPARVALDPS